MAPIEDAALDAELTRRRSRRRPTWTSAARGGRAGMRRTRPDEGEDPSTRTGVAAESAPAGWVKPAKARAAIYLLACAFPWGLRRRVLELFLGYELHPTSRILRSWVLPRGRFALGPGAIVGPFCMIGRGVDDVIIAGGAQVGPLNWISGEPRDNVHYLDQPARRSQLLLEEHTTITARHYINCTDSVIMRRFSVLGGNRSSVWTHGLDYRTARQVAGPIEIGEYSLVAASCVLLPGAKVPHHSVIGAMSLVTKPLAEPYRLYGGTPAKEIAQLREDEAMFTRETGFFA